MVSFLRTRYAWYTPLMHLTLPFVVVAAAEGLLMHVGTELDLGRHNSYRIAQD